MGREVKRVALDFAWPVGETYEGFLMPEDLQAGKCPDCENGYSVDGKRLHDEWWGYTYFDPVAHRGARHTADTIPGFRAAIERKITNDYDGTGDAPRFYMRGFRTLADAVESECQRMLEIHNRAWRDNVNQAEVDWILDNKPHALHELTSEWVSGEGWVPKVPAIRPTADEVNHANIMQTMGLSHWGAATEARAAIEGVDTRCATCDGEGEAFRDDAHKAAHDAWEPTEPPEGEGWQMWENTSEGSPISPVFATAEELAHWLANTNASAMGGSGATYEQWMAMIGDGWAPSLIIADGKMMSGVEAAAER